MPKTIRPNETQSADAANRAPAVARAATILRLLASERGQIGVNEIARRARLVPSTCLHILRALVEEGFVSFDEGKKTYSIGVGLLALVRSAFAHNDFAKAVQPCLDRLAATSHVTALAGEIDDRGHMITVAMAKSDMLISLHVDIGSRFPAYIGATGRCVAAASGLSRAELKTRFDTLRWDRAPDFGSWYHDVERARVDGVAMDRGNYLNGLALIATLLPARPGDPMRGIALLDLAHNMTDEVAARLKKALLTEAAWVAERLL